MKTEKRLSGLWLLNAFATCLPAFAEVRLPSVLGDGMVLQRDMPAPIWGTASPGEKVSVAVAGQEVSTTAGDDGRWLVKLPPLKAGGPFEMTVAGRNTITRKDILVGEVWICSGQSNMVWWVRASANAEQEAAAANYPQIRLFTVKAVTASQPRPDTEGTWQPCSPKTVPDFSAVAYFFGRHLHKELGVPVGLINTAWGGTPAESWMSRAAMESDPEFRPILDRWSRQVADSAAAMRDYAQKVTQWVEDVQKADAAGRPLPAAPQPPNDARSSPHRPSVLFNAMIHPLIPFAIRGAIWYQGESNAGRAYQYRKLFPAMIQDWRRAWGQGDFPFLYVQLANFMKAQDQPGVSAWAELREAQTMTLALPNTAMAVTIDVGDAADIHPKNKQDVGKRLALAALARAYGRDIPYSGPLYQSMKVEGDSVRLRFQHVDGGLVAQGGEPLRGFAIAGDDRNFVWADAKIDGNTIVVRSDKVARPVAVRYAWADNPVCNLFNKAGLPASPFRTDDWPGITVNER